LAGALIRVDFRDGTFRNVPIVAGPSPAEGSVSDPGFLSFSVVGDPGTANWSLTNLYSADIDTILIGLATGLGFTDALFDNNSIPSSPNSGSGVAGATRVSGPVPFFSFEFLSWQDPMNQGNMFEQQQISFVAGATTTPFPTGATFVWTDDTDNVAIATCGNGALEGAEECDDGNTISGDGCSATCQIEAPAPVPALGPVATALLGTLLGAAGLRCLIDRAD